MTASGPVAERPATSNSDALSDGLRAAQPAPGTVRVDSDEYRALLAVQRRMLDDRDALRSGRLAAPELTGAGADRGCFGVDVVDGPARLTVLLPRITDAADRWFKQRYGVAPRYTAGVGALDMGPAAAKQDQGCSPVPD